MKLLYITLIALILLNTSVFANTRDGLIGWWKMDETSGTNSFDSSWNGNTGTLTNSPVITNNCVRGNCLTFTTANSTYVLTTLTSDSNFISSSNITFSLALWFNANNGITTTDMLFTKQVSTVGGWAINFAGGTQAINVIQKGSVGNNVLTRSTSTTGLNDGKWHHLVGIITCNSTNSTGQDIQIYLDGASNQGTLTNTAASVGGGTQAVVFGGRPGGVTTLYFGGMLDDVRIYNRGLTAQEVLDLYNSGIKIKGNGTILKGNGTKFNY